MKVENLIKDLLKLPMDSEIYSGIQDKDGHYSYRDIVATVNYEEEGESCILMGGRILTINDFVDIKTKKVLPYFVEDKKEGLYCDITLHEKTLVFIINGNELEYWVRCERERDKRGVANAKSLKELVAMATNILRREEENK